MRNAPNLRIESYRVKDGPFATTLEEHGRTGAFFFPAEGGRRDLSVIACDEGGWDQVSVAVLSGSSVVTWKRPTCEEMDWVKKQFFNDDETVVEYQFHEHFQGASPVVRSMWRLQEGQLPEPLEVMVEALANPARRAAVFAGCLKPKIYLPTARGIIRGNGTHP